MGRMHEALRKAAEERERRRRQRARPPVPPGEEEETRTAEITGSKPTTTESHVVEVSPAASPAATELAPPPSPAATEVAPPSPPSPGAAPPRAPAEAPPPPPAVAGPLEAAPPPELLPPPPPARRRRERAAPDRVREPLPVPVSRRDRRRGRRRRRRAGEERLPVRVLGAAPGLDPRIVMFHRPRDQRAEQFRAIRTNILSQDPQPRSILLASGSPGEGKSLAAANLAVSFVEGGDRRVLVVDCNVRYPEMAELLAGRSSPGLADVLSGKADARSCVQSTGIPGVDLLAAGDAVENPGALLVRGALARVMEDAGAGYDHIVVDSPSLVDFADAAVLAPEVDGVVVVVQVEGPPREQSERALELLEASRARVLGAVVTNCR